MATELNIGVFHQSLSDPEKLAAPETKHYSCRHPGQTVICGDGSELQFIGGVFSTQDPYLINILDKQAKYPGSMIFAGRNDLGQRTVLDIAAEDNATLSKVATASDSGTRANESDVQKAQQIVKAAG